MSQTHDNQFSRPALHHLSYMYQAAQLTGFNPGYNHYMYSTTDDISSMLHCTSTCVSERKETSCWEDGIFLVSQLLQLINSTMYAGLIVSPSVLLFVCFYTHHCNIVTESFCGVKNSNELR